MTIITGKEFRSNQGKYIGMAHRGERVVISSRSGYAELTPITENDREVMEQINEKGLHAIESRIKKRVKEGKMLMFNTVDELRKHLASL